MLQKYYTNVPELKHLFYRIRVLGTLYVGGDRVNAEEKRRCAIMIHALVDQAIADGSASEATKRDGHRFAAELYREAHREAREQEQKLREDGVRSYAEL